MAAVEDKPTFKKDTWYYLKFKVSDLTIDGKPFKQSLNNTVEYHVRFDKEKPIDYHTILLKTIRYPLSFWKMVKLWRQNRRSDLCR